MRRTTIDADLGIPPVVVRSAEVVRLLLEAGYKKEKGNRFSREIEHGKVLGEGSRALVDILVPSYTSRARENVVISEDLTTIEVPGLALALKRPPALVEVALDMVVLERTTVTLPIPDEASALALKVLAWRRRRAAKDIVDVWRLLEVAAAADVAFKNIEPAFASVAHLLQDAFSSRSSDAMLAIAQERSLNVAAADRLFVRIQSLTDRVVS